MPLTATYGVGEFGLGHRVWGGFINPEAANAAHWPALEIAVSLTTNPADAPLWIDITGRIRGFWIRRGRSNELARFEAGTAGLTIDNRDRYFDPTNTASPHFPNVRPMRRVRISARWKHTRYDLFSGYVERWPPIWEAGTDGTVEVQAADAFKVFALQKLSTSFAMQRSDVRVANVLDLVGWPAADRNLYVGQSNVQGATLDKVEVLTHMQAVETAENGQLFMTGAGQVLFLDRLSPSIQGTIGGAVFGDVDGELPYEDLEVDYGDDQIYNEVKFTREGGAEQTVSDATSIARYYTRTLTNSGLQVTSDSEALAAAQYQLGKRKEPVLKFPSMTVNPGLEPALWYYVLGLEMGSSIVVRRRPPDFTGAGPLIEKTVRIEGVNHDVSRGVWRTQWPLSEPDIQEIWQLDSATRSQLDSTTKLSY